MSYSCGLRIPFLTKKYVVCVCAHVQSVRKECHPRMAAEEILIWGLKCLVLRGVKKVVMYEYSANGS